MSERQKRIKTFLKHIATQDNRATAFPIFYVIRSKYNDSWREENMFLTEVDANMHFEQNRYNYPDDAHVYVKHAFRAPWLRQFLFDLMAEFEIELDKGKL